MRGSKFSADMHNYIWCPIYIPSNMIIGSVVSEKLRWQDFGTDGQTFGRTDRQTDGVTALLDLLSPSAVQVKTWNLCKNFGPSILIQYYILWVTDCHPHSFHWPCSMYRGWMTATPYWPCTCPVGPALLPMSAGWSRPARWGSHRTPLLG